jgi:NitT/TauT family transport system permease protein
MPRINKVLMQISGILIIIVIWELATAYLHMFKPVILPPPSTVFSTMISMIGDGELFMHAGYSLMRVLLGFIVAAIIAIPLGIAMGWVKEISYVVDPIMEVLRPIPPIAWIGLAILWFGLGLNSAIFLVFIGAFFPILLNTISGVRSVDKKLLEVAATFGASDLEVLRKVVHLHRHAGRHGHRLDVRRGGRDGRGEIRAGQPHPRGLELPADRSRLRGHDHHRHPRPDHQRPLPDCR